MTRIVYVDDEPDLREIAVMSLELDPGFEVRSCASGAELLALIGTWRPDLILLDVMMPELDGPSTLRRLRESGDAPPVVFITARVGERDKEQLMESGAAGVITKPFDPMTLASVVRGYLQP